MQNVEADVFQQIGEVSDDVYFVYDVSSGQFQYISPALATIWGLPPDQVMADPALLIKIVHPNDRLQVVDAYKKIVDTKRGEKFEFKIKRRDRQERFIQITVFVLNQENEKFLLAGIAGDTTTSKTNTEYAEKINARKNSALVILAHDLKGPTGTINMLASSIEKHVRDHTARPLQIIQSLCQRNIDLINNLLNQEFLESPEVELRKERVDLVWAINDVIDQYKRSADVLSRTFILNSAHKDLYVYVDGLKLMQALNNLISNSIKFTKDNGTIAVTVKSTRRLVLISVSDDGIGIPEELQPFLFDKFTRARRTGLRGEETTGLGMAAIKTLVELHKGKIWFESEVNKGSTFYIELPVS